MNAERTILVGYDGSEGGSDALALALLLLETTGGRALVASVLGAPDYLLVGEDRDAAIARYADPLFATARDRLGGFEVETVTDVDSSPGRVLHELVESRSPLLTVIGSARHGTAGRMLLGDVGTALLSGARCPIAVAPRGYADRAEHRLRKVGIAVDGSRESLAAVEAGAGLAARTHASLELIGVADLPPTEYADIVGILTAGEDRVLEHRHMQRVLDEASNRLPTGLVATHRLLEGDPAEKIVEAGAGLDLLVLGSRGYGPIRRALLGGVSAKVMRSAQCPVLIVPRGAGEDALRFGFAETAPSPEVAE